MTVAVKEREDQTTMKVSELLKKVGYIKGAAIRIEFKADKTDAEPDVEHLDADTTEETADLVIKRAEEYTSTAIGYFLHMTERIEKYRRVHPFLCKAFSCPP